MRFMPKRRHQFFFYNFPSVCLRVIENAFAINVTVSRVNWKTSKRIIFGCDRIIYTHHPYPIKDWKKKKRKIHSVGVARFWHSCRISMWKFILCICRSLWGTSERCENPRCFQFWLYRRMGVIGVFFDLHACLQTLFEAIAFLWTRERVPQILHSLANGQIGRRIYGYA